jgi:predicted negative regulator of RcsB-dependent stress response
MGAIITWLFDDIWHAIAIVLALFVVLLFIGFKYESYEATKYQTDAIKYQNAFEQQKLQTALCDKNKAAVLESCNKNEKVSQGTLGSCEKFLKICDNTKGGTNFDKDTIQELRLITIRFNDGMRGSETGSPAN